MLVNVSHMQVAARNALDIKLYQWARQKYRPDMKLYDDYASFMADHVFEVILVSVSMSFVCFGMLLSICLLCRRVWSWRTKAKQGI